MAEPESIASILGRLLLGAMRCEDRSEARGPYSAGPQAPSSERRRYSAGVSAEPVVFGPEPGQPRSPKGRAERLARRSVVLVEVV